MSALTSRPRSARRFNARDRRVDLRPVALARDLEVIDLGVLMRRARDVEHFVDAFEQPVAFAAHVADVAAARFGRRERERLELRRSSNTTPAHR